MDIFKNMPTPTAPEPEVESRMLDKSTYVVQGTQVLDRREDKASFTSTGADGSSAIYAQDGGTVYLKNAKVHGYGEMTQEDMRNELASKYGFCSAVLSNGLTSNITLIEPEIVCHESSTANGVYAIFNGGVVIKGGSITTNNRMGHGADASYRGHIYLDGTVIHTGGTNSGALATDFQGGYITARNISATAERPGSPAIYTAGKSIITCYDSTLVSKGCEAVMAAHSLGHTYLYNCDVTGTVGLNVHNGMGGEPSYIHMLGGKLTSTDGAWLNAEDGSAVMDLEGVAVGGMNGSFMAAKAGGRLVANLSDMTVEGPAVKEPKSYMALNLSGTAFKGQAVLTGLSLDASSRWDVAGDSQVAELALEKGAVIAASAPVTVSYGCLAEGTVLPEAENVTFVQNSDLRDDFEAKKMGPPPGAPGQMPPEGMPMPPM